MKFNELHRGYQWECKQLHVLEPVFSSRISTPRVVFCIRSSSSDNLPPSPPAAQTLPPQCHPHTPARPALSPPSPWRGKVTCSIKQSTNTEWKHMWQKPYLLRKSLKGVLVNLWKSLRALSSFHTLMMLLRRALSFSCSTSRNWRVCLTIQTQDRFKCDRMTILKEGVIKSFLPHFLFVFCYPLLDHLTQSLSSV